MSQPLKVTSRIRLRNFNPGYHEGLDKDKTRAKTAKLCERIGELQHLLYANHSHSLLIVLQGLDTSGKDGAAKNVLTDVSPSGVETTSFKAPTSEELSHDYLWRIHQALPRLGNIGVFNRSHYEDVLVVRVLNLVPREVWSARYEQINAFERYLTRNHVVVLKFFLHISKDEQARRLQSRLEDPAKKWKFELNDLKMRAHWNRFQEAYNDVLNRCSPDYAPWHIVPANHKWYRDHVIARTVMKSLEKLNLRWPRPKLDLSKINIK